MRSRTLLTQVLAVNAIIVGLTAFVAAVVARERFEGAVNGRGMLLLGLALLSVLLLNSILLRRRLEPLEQLLETMDEIDLSTPGRRATASRHAANEIKRLHASFNRMLERIEDERRASGRAVLEAQEEERQRIAQDLHDEVNQALTAIKLRLSATIHDAPEDLQHELRETNELVDQAMEELLHLARELRPTALDDHGLVAALRSQVDAFGERTGIRATFAKHGGDGVALSDEEQLVIYRVTQESLSNIVQHAKAENVTVELNFTGRTVLKVSDDGRGFKSHRVGSSGRLGVSGMKERALLVGGNLSIFSEVGEGTTVELTMGG
jgi:two-component system sensor histidine kinase UhpB